MKAEFSRSKNPNLQSKSHKPQSAGRNYELSPHIKRPSCHQLIAVQAITLPEPRICVSPHTHTHTQRQIFGGLYLKIPCTCGTHISGPQILQQEIVPNSRPSTIFSHSPAHDTSLYAPCIYKKYRYVQNNDVSVNDPPHIRRWSHRIIITPLCYNCLQYSVQ
jgi:hypothetical protein